MGINVRQLRLTCRRQDKDFKTRSKFDSTFISPNLESRSNLARALDSRFHRCIDLDLSTIYIGLTLDLLT